MSTSVSAIRLMESHTLLRCSRHPLTSVTSRWHRKPLLVTHPMSTWTMIQLFTAYKTTIGMVQSTWCLISCLQSRHTASQRNRSGPPRLENTWTHSSSGNCWWWCSSSPDDTITADFVEDISKPSPPSDTFLCSMCRDCFPLLAFSKALLAYNFSEI